MELISTQSIVKRFGKTPVINEVSIQINQGEIYGFLGLNGAGKTTLIRILLGMIKPNRGSVKLFGKKVGSNFNQWNDIGYLVETPYSYPNLSVTENLNVYYQLRQIKNANAIRDIIDRLKLSPYANTKTRHLSLGNQQRLGLAKALMHKPKLLILDEPINGLDPEGIVEVRELIKELAHTGSTVFLSSHILGEISKVANRIAIIHQGKIRKELTTNELTSQLVKKVLVKTNDNPGAINHLINSNYQAALNENDEIEITDSKAISNPEHISKLLVEKELPPKQVSLFTEDLEMYFLRTIRS